MVGVLKGGKRLLTIGEDAERPGKRTEAWVASSCHDGVEKLGRRRVAGDASSRGSQQGAEQPGGYRVVGRALKSRREGKR